MKLKTNEASWIDVEECKLKVGGYWSTVELVEHKVGEDWVLSHRPQRVVKLTLIPNSVFATYTWAGYVRDAPSMVIGEISPTIIDGLSIRELVSVAENSSSIQLGFYNGYLPEVVTHLKVGSLPKTALNGQQISNVWSQYFFVDPALNFFAELQANLGKPIPVELYLRDLV